MRKKLLLVSLSLVLALIGMMPATAALAKPAIGVVATGFVTEIQTTGENVVPIGNWGWKVTDRTVKGVFNGPEIVDEFTFTYNAIVDLTQAGMLWGTLSTGDYTLNVFGRSESAYFYGWYDEAAGIPLYGLDVSGSWNARCGAVGGGQFTASLVFIPSADGAHIEYIIPPLSPITLTGKLTPVNWWWYFWRWFWGGRH